MVLQFIVRTFLLLDDYGFAGRWRSQASNPAI